MIIKFGMYEKLFTKKVLNIAKKNLMEVFEYDTVDYISREEKENCYLEVSDMSLKTVRARVVDLDCGVSICDDIIAFIEKDIFE